MIRILLWLAHYPSLAWNVVICRWLHIWNWWDQVNARLFLGARPFRSDVRRLHDLGVRAVINTCEEFGGHVEEYAKVEITQLHLPTVDYSTPSFADVKCGVDFIEDHLNRGHAVFVHCKAGRVRSATIALCWLMRAHKLEPAEALRRLREKRPRVSRSLAKRPVVRQFWASIADE